MKALSLPSSFPQAPFVFASLQQLDHAIATEDYAQYVNPLVGSQGPYSDLAFGGGDIFVGGVLPFGVVKLGLDTYESNTTLNTLNGGYTPNGSVTAISMMHESGTGGFPKYGIVPQMPLTTIAAPVNILDNRTYWQHRTDPDVARVGYFKTHLQNGVNVELSASRHAGIMQYSFPAGEKHVLVDISHYLPDENGGYSVQAYLGGEIEVSESGQKYTGYGTYGGGWNEGAPFTVYFCGQFEDTPDQAQTFHGRNTDPIQRAHTFSNQPIGNATFGGNKQTSGPLNNRVGAVFSWNSSYTSTIKSKVGISFISTDKACHFKNEEISTWQLNDTVDAAIKEWNRDVFSKIQVPTGKTANMTNLALLYTSLYFTHLMPSDRSGENPLWDSGEPYWDDWYTAWDIFRCTVSLYHLIQPSYYETMIRSLIDIWRYEGYMPDGRSGNYNGLVQGGSNADNILADAYVKGLRGQVNWTAGYEAMKKNAEAVPYNTYSQDDPSASVKEGRGALQDWLDLGYLSSDQSTRAVSRTVEYAANDFSLAQVAKDLAPDDVEKYRNRSANWQNIWAHNVTTHGFSGFLAPRLANGTFNLTDYNPALCGECEWQAISYEATPFEYSFVVPFDMATLIDFSGGSNAFESRLDYIFQPNTSEQNLGANGAGITTLMNIGNEPDFATPLLYHYLGKSFKSVQRARGLAHQFFRNEDYGVPGNSDAGALNSWLVWQMMGLYPVVTQPVYLLTSPWFPEMTVSVGINCSLTIVANGLDEASGSVYVQGVRINGEPWNKNWFEHDEVMNQDSKIEFDLGMEQKIWETAILPPSPGWKVGKSFWLCLNMLNSNTRFHHQLDNVLPRMPIYPVSLRIAKSYDESMGQCVSQEVSLLGLTRGARKVGKVHGPLCRWCSQVVREGPGDMRSLDYRSLMLGALSCSSVTTSATTPLGTLHHLPTLWIRHIMAIHRIDRRPKERIDLLALIAVQKQHATP
ncbi:hypothetical protein FH972_021049 [Carpinus fangiana]|uniref:Glycosyl hydrolase family 92 domain-containing protein n=1 Tax=Carpinus fangiana TaxID=176857 RepID=A0A5N6KNU3_9ROSI|nr:hypothetical protein FH972_021049 [Carpinus fangiana]